MRKLLSYATVLFLVVALLVSVVHIASQRLPSDVASSVLTVDSCAQPCWHSIQPGLTTIDNAYALLKADSPLIENLNLGQLGREVPPEQALCWSIAVSPRWRGCVGRNSTYTGPLELIELSPPANAFTLGQAVAMFSDPEAVEMCRSYARVFFAHDIEVLVAGRRPPALDPQENVLLIRFLYPGDEPPYRFDTPAWHGFIGWHGEITC